MGARVNRPSNFTPECFLDYERSGTTRRVQDAEVSSEHETLDPEESKAMALREEGDIIIVFNANGPLLGIGEGKLSTCPELNGLFQPRAIASYKPMKEFAGVPRWLRSRFLNPKEVKPGTMRLLTQESNTATGPIGNLHTTIP